MTELTREKRIYLACWRKALKEEAIINLKMPDTSTAVTVRMAMYRAIQPYRKTPELDPVLYEASEKYVLNIKDNPPRIEITPRKTLSVAEDLADLLGIEGEDLLTEEERQMDGALKAMLKEQTIDPSTGPNPFFKRQ